MKKIFKKMTASLMSGLMLLGSTYAIAGSASAANNEVQPRGTWAMYGDVNNNGKIDMSDAVCIMQAFQRFENLTGSSRLPLEYAVARPAVYFGEGDYIPQAADLNNDNYIDNDDAVMIQYYCLELPDKAGRCGQPFYIN